MHTRNVDRRLPSAPVTRKHSESERQRQGGRRNEIGVDDSARAQRQLREDHATLSPGSKIGTEATRDDMITTTVNLA